MLQRESITITDQDHRRLREVALLYGERDSEAASSLLEELERAIVVSPSALEPSVVTMNSRVTCRNQAGELRKFELVYPRDADVSVGRISVLAPLGRALLGAAVGDRITVETRGRAATWVVEAIHYQPEAAGDFHL